MHTYLHTHTLPTLGGWKRKKINKSVFGKFPNVNTDPKVIVLVTLST